MVRGSVWSTSQQEALDEQRDAEILFAVQNSMRIWRLKKQLKSRSNYRYDFIITINFLFFFFEIKETVIIMISIEEKKSTQAFRADSLIRRFFKDVMFF